MAKPNYYETLHIPFNATQEEITKAYRRLAKKYHPDLNPDKDTTSIMQEINEAYENLSNLSKRKEYDSTLKKERNDQAYSSYTKTQEESEADLDDWLKEYLHKKRKLDKVFKLYVDIAARNIKMRKAHIIPTYIDLEKEEFLSQELINALHDFIGLNKNNPNQIQILNELFIELEGPTEAIDLAQKSFRIPEPENEIKQNIILLEIKAILNNFTNKNNPQYTTIMAYILERFLQVKIKIDDMRAMCFHPSATDILIHKILSGVIKDNYTYYENLFKSANNRK